MDCKEFEKMIPAFLENALSYKATKRFLEHVDSCPECQEELTIKVLVSEGMARLEEGSAFDIQKELDRHIQEAHKRIRLHKMFKYASITLEIVAFIAIVLVIIFLVL